MSETAVREPQKQSLVNRDFILMMLVNVCLSVGFYFFQPVLPGYITSMGISITVAGIIAGLFSFTALVARPFTGLLSDRISPKIVLLIALPLEAVFGAGYGFFPSIAGLVFCRIVHAVGFSFAGTVAVVYGSFVIPKERMGEGIGWLSLGSILGTAIGPSIGLGLADMLGYKISFLIGGIIFFVGAVLVGLTRP
ncbi:MAG: MFS transporter, partial [Lachnospiraceae bacterium]|nr:MFS transporter [Lachnospiraceae bacterium]